MSYPIETPIALIEMGYDQECADLMWNADKTALELFGWHCPGDPPTPEQVVAHLESSAHLTALKEQAHEQRRARRTQAELAGFTHVVGEDSYRIDSDRDSILRISNAANAALTATITQSPWSTVWACADGQSLPLDAPGMLALQISLAVHGQMCHTRSQALAAEIEAAADLAALAAIDINSGWPA